MPLPDLIEQQSVPESEGGSSSGNGGIPPRCSQHATRLALLETSLADQTQHLCEIKETLKQEFVKSSRRIGKVAKAVRKIQGGTTTKLNVLWYFVATIFAAGIAQLILGKFFK